MSTQFTNRQWRLPNNENKDKQSNYSMDFDGSQYIDTNQTLDSSYSALTLSAWVNYTSISDYSGTIFGQWIQNNNSGSTIICYTVSNKIQVYLGPSATSLTSTTTLTTGTWYNVILRFDGSTMKLYINGTEEDSVSFTSINNSAQNLILGAYSNSTQTGYQAFLNGLIDAVSIYNYALSSSQITTLYGSNSTGIGNPMSLSPKPVAYYPLGDQDAFNGSNYLVPNNSLEDYVFDFDGSNDYIDCGDSDNFSFGDGTNDSPFSVSAWVKYSTIPTNPPFISKFAQSTSLREYAFWLQSTATIRFYLADGSSYCQAISTTTLSSNTWYHVVATYDGRGGSTAYNGINLYINGVQENSTNNGSGYTAMSNTNQPIEIGRYQSTRYFDGSISNAQIFNTELPATGSNSVETLYNNGSPLTSMTGFSSLVGWWKLDASEVYNNTSTEWSIDNNQNPSAYASSLNFNGSGDRIDITGLPDFGGGSLTTSFWIKSGVDANNAYILSRSGFSFTISQSGTNSNLRYRVQTSAANTIYGNTILDNTWHHCVMTFDSTANEFKVFEDGVQVSSTVTTSGSLASGTSTVYLASFATGAPFKSGNFSNLSMWNAALTPTQVTELYNNGTPSNLSSHSATSNLVSWYKLNNTTTGIEDAKGSNDGTNNGATEYAGFVNALAGESSGMSQANLVASDLSFKTSYSPYALNFDAASGDYINLTNPTTVSDSFTVGFWINCEFIGVYDTIVGSPANTGGLLFALVTNASGILMYKDSTTNWTDLTNVAIDDGNWHFLAVTYNSTTTEFKGFVDGSENLTVTNPQWVGRTTNQHSFTMIGSRASGTTYTLNGSLSNLSVWNTALTSAQVSEIYNEGVPSNLNNHSAYSNLISWWQLGSNSSFNTNWAVLDEKGGNNGTSVNMGEDAIIDGVGSYANGLSSGMGGDEVIGDAPYSTANALSVNMDVEDRVTDTPS